MSVLHHALQGGWLESKAFQDSDILGSPHLQIDFSIYAN